MSSSEEGEVHSDDHVEGMDHDEEEGEDELVFLEFREKESSRGNVVLAAEGYEYVFEAQSKLIPGHFLILQFMILLSDFRDRILEMH